ncbi:hypothetical protein OIDMADRAFT_52989 [Oidiodendron maius Zn]|uniref:Uncharacterized protein n=1 Tax=Oidiodendron maius (strain Zn) TaxID=913774 RepID=A0A0C3DMF3_OIDMZ|nr:hypothetical protein OIDMADRAFT_52989 [Oidiodendron maius Zn]
MASLSCEFPLERITETELQDLCRVLWSWPPCEERRVGKPCENCPPNRSKRLGQFFDYYKGLTASYDPDNGPGERPALSTHQNLFEIIQVLKAEPTRTRKQLLHKAFPNEAGQCSVSATDQENAINLAVKIMIMVNCSAEHPSSGFIEDGTFQIPWRNDVTFTQFITDSFPMTDHPILNDDEELKKLDIKTALTAKKLKKRAGLKFRPTDDLRSHLKFDRKTAVVEVYHHTAFLKEHLRLTKDKHLNVDVTEALKLGALPRQLALETLDSIQKILFPLADPKSRALLRSLTCTSSFDPDSLRFESASIRNGDEKDIRYHYLGARLADLYEELENPTPRGMEKWFQRKSGARYVMMATFIGVVIAILFGMAGLALSIYQSWLTYQQWQHPIQLVG